MIGLISLNINTDDLNYGAILHTWAFQQIIQDKLGSGSNEVINYIPSHLETFNRNKPITSYIRQHDRKNTIKLILCREEYLKRLRKFERFTKEHLIVSKNQYNEERLNETILPYDVLICESDVIWSIAIFKGKFEETFFLALDSMKEKKRYAYSASAANMEFTKEEFDKFDELVKNFDMISCRESYLSDYLENNLTIHAPHVLDPVMLVDKEKYLNLMSDRLIKEPYLLIYVPVQLNKKIYENAKKYARENNLKIIEVSMHPWHRFRHKVIIDAGVEEFLSLIYYADCIFTSSFHAVCFSMIFEKEFYAFSRKTGRKTEDLCKNFKVSNRYILCDEGRNQTPIDYTEINKQFEMRKKISMEYIDTMIADFGEK